MQWRITYEAYMRYVRKHKLRRFYICAMRGIPLPCLAMRAHAGIYSTNCTFTPSKARRRPYTLVCGLIHYIWDVDFRRWPHPLRLGGILTLQTYTLLRDLHIFKRSRAVLEFPKAGVGMPSHLGPKSQTTDRIPPRKESTTMRYLALGGHGVRSARPPFSGIATLPISHLSLMGLPRQGRQRSSLGSGDLGC